jgi:hypothetical protein
MEDANSDKLTLEEAIGKNLPKYYSIQPWQFILGIIFILLVIVLISNSVWNLLSERGN